ncbi:MAG TPA: hypothetical protein VI542_23150 [Candidatus Tectomicrobia bacterium]
MKRVMALSVAALLGQGCMYGVVQDANTGSGVNQATVKVINGSCSGAGCGGSPVSENTDVSGLYIFDAYGNSAGPADVKIILPASGEEAVTLRIEKSGYVSRTIYHQPKYQQVTNNGKTYLITQASPVYLCPVGSPDSDGDSICNAAESRYGTDPFDSDTDGDNLSDAAELFGSEGVDLRYFGTTPLHKDLFIEADYYPGLKPADAAIAQVVAAFANAPVSNPDGISGIRLHIDVDQQIAAADVDNDLNPVWTDFDVIKNTYFEPRRSKLFHYALFANQYDGGGSSGISRGIPGHDFVVSLGTWSTPGGTVLQQAGTLMHEFGHNIGLRHGGNENENRKPNYLSIMSYNYQLVGLTIAGVGGNMDYSRLRIASVNEASLNEVAAFAGIGGTTEAQLAPYGVRTCGTLLTGNASTNLDFDKDGVIEAVVATSLNCDADAVDVFAASQNDWDNLVYNGAGTIGDDLLGDTEQLLAGYYEVTPVSLVEPCMTEFQ